MNTMDRGEISRPFPASSRPVKQAIVVDLDHLRQLMREFLADMETKGHATVFDADSLTDWKFEVFLQWLQTKQTKEAHSGEKWGIPMRVNVYAEEMTDRIEIIAKEIEGQQFTGLRFYLELPASFIHGDDSYTRGLRPATPEDTTQAEHYQAPFIHRPGDDDSAAVTFWGKRDLREVLQQALTLLDEHYKEKTNATK